MKANTYSVSGAESYVFQILEDVGYCQRLWFKQGSLAVLGILGKIELKTLDSTIGR